MVCPRWHVAALAAVLPLAAFGQTPAPREPRTIDSTHSTTLSPEKQAQVREALGRIESMSRGESKLPRVDATLQVGAAIPESVEPLALPDDRVTEVPQVTSYRFVAAANGIAVVDPDTRRVVQVIAGP